MRFSAFAPFGPLRFSSKKTHGQAFYEEMVKALGNGKNFSDDFNGLAMARVYANAMAFGRCRYTLERAASQFRPDRALELLPTLEREYGLVPAPGSSITERRAELAVAAWVARGARRSNVEAILTELFGAGFVEYVTIAAADAVTAPAASPESVGVYDKPGTQRSAFRIAAGVSTTNTQITVSGELIAGLARAPEPGSKFVIDAGDPGRTEAVTVLSASLSGTALTLAAVFARPHNPGVVLATGRHANQATTKRHNIFALSSAATRDNTTRRRLHRAAGRLLRGVSTWSLTDGSGPFRVGVGRLGVTTIR